VCKYLDVQIIFFPTLRFKGIIGKSEAYKGIKTILVRTREYKRKYVEL
jgi:hypothetical protein